LPFFPRLWKRSNKPSFRAEEEALQKAEEKTKAKVVLAAQENVGLSSDSTKSTTQPNQTTDTPVEPPNSTSLSGPDQVQPATIMADTVLVLADAEMVDASEILRASPLVNAEAVAPLPVVETQSSSDSSASAPEHVTVMIHGSAVDITDTGINPTFLKALLMICGKKF
jgi:hypothetical protein